MSRDPTNNAVFYISSIFKDKVKRVLHLKLNAALHLKHILLRYLQLRYPLFSKIKQYKKPHYLCDHPISKYVDVLVFKYSRASTNRAAIFRDLDHPES